MSIPCHRSSAPTHYVSPRPVSDPSMRLQTYGRTTAEGFGSGGAA